MGSSLALLAGAAGLIAALIEVNRRLAAARRAELVRRGMSLSAGEIATGAVKPDKIIEINFGYGPERWAVLGDAYTLDARARVLRGAKRILPDPGGPSVEEASEKAGCAIERLSFRR
ncbi:hypothetical protein WME90_28540 [Sorangium sp. So ce375]|uniref:hypothetical protein n=1 Tax=Sorangium sp. So ce375 TaxID=3133306 RepID=UPI003F5C42C1